MSFTKSRRAAVLLLCLAAAGCTRVPGRSDHQRGLAALKEGNPVVAKGLIEKALRSMPQDATAAPAYNHLGLVYLELQDADNAASAFRASRRLDATYAPPAYNMGVLLYRADDPAGALSQFEEAARLDPKDTAALEFAAHVRMQQNEWRSAAELLREAVSRSPRSARALTALGVAAVRAEGPSEALNHLQEALRVDPNYAPAYYNQAVVYHRFLGERDLATRALETYLLKASDPAHVAAAHKLLQSLAPPETVGVPGTVTGLPTPSLPGVGPAEAAEAAAAPPAAPAEAPGEDLLPGETAAAEIPAVPESTAASALVLFQRAQAWAAEGRIEEAGPMFRAAAEQAAAEGDAALQERILLAGATACPDDAPLMRSYGQLLLDQGRFERALRAFKQAVIRDPHDASVYVGMARAARETGQRDAAEAALNRALRMDRANEAAMLALAELYEGEKRPEEALRLYQEFTRTFPAHADVPQIEGKMLALTSQARSARTPEPATAPRAPPPTPPARADPTPTAATEPPPPAEPRFPGEPAAERPRVVNVKAARDWYNRGMIYKARADWDNAILHFQKALEQDDSMVAAYNELGVVHHKKGETAVALQMYRRVLEKDPNEVGTRYNVALLYHETQRDEEALAQVEQILRLRPDYAPAHYLLGIMYSKHPRTLRAAVKHYRVFLRLTPNDPAAPAVRQWLEQNAPREP